MKLTYYGTAAAEGFPGIFCECKYCKRARSLGGKNFRSKYAGYNDETFVELEFLYGDKKYIITRKGDKKRARQGKKIIFQSSPD